MKKLVYTISVILTAIFLFWPVLYTALSRWVTLPGNPLIQAVIGVLLFGTLAYLSFEEEAEGDGEATAS